MVKVTCRHCNEVAVWKYEPMDANWSEADRHYCDDHIRRGCSCNIDLATDEEPVDERGRFYPCVEYNYHADGFYYDPEGSWIMRYEDWTPFVDDHEWDLLF